jgi:heme exporter protein B
MATSRSLPKWSAQVGILLRKDLTVELRSGEVLVTSAFFAALVVVIASLAFYVGPSTRNQVAAGCLWLAVAFAAVLALSRLWQREREDSAIDGLLVAPIAPSAIFASKALGLALFLFAIELIVVPLTSLFFALDLDEVWLGLVLIAVAATPGIAAAGSLFGAMTARTRARDLVLAIVLFPLLAPSLLTAVVATRELLGGAPLSELTDYAELLGVFDITFIAGGLGLFGILMDG